jgi:hypothetical protein
MHSYEGSGNHMYSSTLTTVPSNKVSVVRVNCFLRRSSSCIQQRSYYNPLNTDGWIITDRINQFALRLVRY